YHGLTLLAALAGAALIGVQALRGNVRWPMILALVLGATQLVWFSYNGRAWVVLGYMLGLFAVLGLVLGDLAQTACRQLRRIAWSSPSICMMHRTTRRCARRNTLQCKTKGETRCGFIRTCCAPIGPVLLASLGSSICAASRKPSTAEKIACCAGMAMRPTVP